MVQDWLIELLWGMAKFFLNPVFYLSVLLAAYLGVSRVKTERKHFHIRAENAYFELKQLLPLGFVIGIAISIVTIGVGVVIPLAAIVFAAALTILLSFTTKIRFLSPAYVVSLAFFIIFLVKWQELPVPFLEDSLEQLSGAILPSIAVLTALLVIGEGILIMKNGIKGSSPRIVRSKRGLPVGIHELKRNWMIPVFLIIPGSVLTPPFEWWPVFSVGGEMYSILLVPFAVGFHQKIQGMLPVESIEIIGKRVFGLGILLALLAAGSYWYPVLAFAVAGLAIIGREFITLRQRAFENNLPFYFSPRNNGVMILGIIPHSPASRMALQVGEIITKVNGDPVNNERTFYEALHKNRAYCKLEVLDINGEIRFVQRALFEGDHYQLGILFVQDGRVTGTDKKTKINESK